MIDLRTFVEKKIAIEKKREYHREYSKKYRALHKPDPIIRKPAFYLKEYEPVPEVYEEKLIIQEITCSYFGCGKKLSRQEKLFGNRCIKHQKKETYKNFFETK